MQQCLISHEEEAGRCVGGLLLKTRPHTDCRKHCVSNISARQFSKQERWRVAGRVHEPHTESRFSFIAAGGLRAQGQQRGNRVNILKRKSGSNIDKLKWL